MTTGAGGETGTDGETGAGGTAATAPTDAPAAGDAPTASEVAFWEGRYQEGRTRWDLGGPTPVFAELLESPAAPKPGRTLVVGCGKGHDVLYFARHGFDVLGV